MKEFIEKLIGRLNERMECLDNKHKILTDSGMFQNADRIADKMTEVDLAKRIVNQLAEEYKHCIKSSCSNCEVYDKENHYCPKWYEVIKGTVAEIEESHNNDFCEWRHWRTINDIPMYRTTCLNEFSKNLVKKYKFCPYCGKKIKVVY